MKADMGPRLAAGAKHGERRGVADGEEVRGQRRVRRGFHGG